MITVSYILYDCVLCFVGKRWLTDTLIVYEFPLHLFIASRQFLLVVQRQEFYVRFKGPEES